MTGISTENPILGDVGKKPMTHLAITLTLLANLFALMAAEPGPLKYGLYASLSVLSGQMLGGFASRLQQQGTLSETLTTSGLVFFAMAVVGIIDNQNLLGWGVYLWVALGVLLIAMIYNIFMTKSDRERADWKVWLARFAVVLFALYVVFDVEVLKANAAACKDDPDYVSESVNLYLDMLNLVTGVGSSQ